MVLFFVMIGSLLIGISIGAIITSYKNRNLLKNQKFLYNELQNNKTKLNEYQKKLNNHFTYNIKLLNKIAENYRDLYQNTTKNASFFLPNIYHHNDIYSFQTKKTNNQDQEQLPTETPLDYSDNTKVLQKKL